ncbi:MAG: L,D-transpeptidase [Gammaproteobacteria bacterium]|nr:L,D-transpeptidase [Gammaproteobacteria bacterium]MBU1558899.1 L,D-transpeptidase [Gammaproteobacteria bacterium]MBU1628528.1 L,D-transpeptidase [Gammaproteobacteria bacterium]MBU1926605.1 L,D-transpeptidase [Gammaproteobacteria bacterium]MBU2545830.1 L,D-transpeptidase [Gammaproteobacteria bacterium]
MFSGSDSSHMSASTSSASDPDGDQDSKGANHFAMTRPATGRRVFIFDPKLGSFAVYDGHGQRMNTGRASGGSVYCPDIGRPCRTIVGRFSIVSKGGADCVSSAYPIETNGGAPMPYCMHFGSKGYAIHGSNAVPDYNASHGCIRVSPTVARWLNTQFMQIGSTVIILPYS